MEAFTYIVHIEAAEEGGFVAYFPELPGCQTQGETFDEVVALAKDALAGYIQASRENGIRIARAQSLSGHVGFELSVTASVPQ